MLSGGTQQETVVWQRIEQGISQATGKPFKVRSSRVVAGGCINEAVCLQGEQRRFFVKLNRADRLHMFEAEAAALAAIRASNSLRAPEPVAWGTSGKNSWLAPLDPGYSIRKQLYNLYHILNHFNLFGDSYAGQAASMIDNLMAHQN